MRPTDLGEACRFTNENERSRFSLTAWRWRRGAPASALFFRVGCHPEAQCALVSCVHLICGRWRAQPKGGHFAFLHSQEYMAGVVLKLRDYAPTETSSS